MLNIRAMAVATAVAAGTVFMIPAAGQAMPVAPVNMPTAQDGNIVQVDHRNNWRRDHRYWRARDARHWRGERWRWRESRNPHRYRAYDPYYDPYYYRRGHGGGPGIGLQFRID